MKNINNSFKILAMAFTAMVMVSFYGCEQFDLDEDPGASRLAVLPYESLAELGPRCYRCLQQDVGRSKNDDCMG